MSDLLNLGIRNFNSVAEGFMNFVREELIDDNTKKLAEKHWELEKYFSSFSSRKMDGRDWNVEKVKILFELLKLRSPEDEERILSFMEHIKCGWQEHEYIFSNRCLRFGDKCKKNYKIPNSPEDTAEAFETLNRIFLGEKYSAVTTYIFSYCLAALFSSKLRREYSPVPFFLEIVCEENSNLYALINEIVDICDVNTGLIEHCTMGYGSCDYATTTVFPNRDTEREVNELIYSRDIPVVIDGYDNEKFYDIFIREITNIAGRKKALSIRDTFNILPIFVCQTSRTKYKNVFSMNLTGVDISDEYIYLIKENKQRLSSWAYELVKDAKKYFSTEKTMDKHEEALMRLKYKNEFPFFKDIESHIRGIRRAYRSYTELSEKDMTNVGFLSFFFSKYMDVFKRSIKLPVVDEFEYGGVTKAHNTAGLVAEIKSKSVGQLVQLHSMFSLSFLKTISVATIESDPVKARQIKKRGEEYAKNIVKYYQSYGVSIKIMSEVKFENERYLFNVELLPGTDKNLIHRYTDEVRRLLGLEFFIAVTEHSSIKIVASEKPLKENSLIKILESQEFRESKMLIPYAVGYDFKGDMVIADVSCFPHLLIGGATNTGKSSALHSLLMSVVCKQKPDKVKLLLLDFGASKLNLFANTPHLLKPVVTSTEIVKGMRYIMALRDEMIERLNTLERDEKKLDSLPSIICVIDEFPTFIRTVMEWEKLTKNKISHTIITDLLERARKVKIHMILAAQDATKKNIGIKMTNLTAAIAFRCTNLHDSMAILGEPDARNLSGKGAMYFKSEQHEGLLRLQGSYMEPAEIRERLENMEFEHNVKDEFKLEWANEPATLLDSNDELEDGYQDYTLEDNNKLLAEIIIWVLSQDQVSNNKIKKKFKIGYSRAEKFLGKLEEYNVVPKQRNKETKLPRDVIPNSYKDIPAEIIEILKHYYSDEEITASIGKRPINHATAKRTEPKEATE